MKCKNYVVNLQMSSKRTLINTSFAALPQLLMSLIIFLIINYTFKHEAT